MFGRHQEGKRKLDELRLLQHGVWIYSWERVAFPNLKKRSKLKMST